MPSSSEPTNSVQADYEALNDFVVNCPELAEMESKIGGFNIFSVLGFEYGELRHSNALAWLFDPEESHGLQDAFLQRWLMTVLHEADSNHAITPVDVDCWSLASVEVRREWKHIDLLILLTMINGDTWVVAIENKVNAKQRHNQLRDYREVVEAEFPHCQQKLFLFLTKNDEAADDEHYLPASYSQVHSVLKQCAAAAEHSIGNEPSVLINNYLRLLEEKFMNESDIARLAQKIYKQHKRAIDIIVDQRPDNLKLCSDAVIKALTNEASSLGIRMETSDRSFIRFTPLCWDTPDNTHGSAWSNCQRHMLIEIVMHGELPELHVVSGKAPHEWVYPLWEKSQDAPFVKPKRAPKKRPNQYAHLHCSPTPCDFDPLDICDPEDIAIAIVDWVKQALAEPSTKQVVDIITAELPKLADAAALEHS